MFQNDSILQISFTAPSNYRLVAVRLLGVHEQSTPINLESTASFIVSRCSTRSERVDSLPGAERLRWLRPGAEAGPGGGAL